MLLFQVQFNPFLQIFKTRKITVCNKDSGEWDIVKLSFNFNYNLVESWDYHYSPILQPTTTHTPTHPTTHPPNRKSSEDCDISAVIDPILMKV